MSDTKTPDTIKLVLGHPIQVEGAELKELALRADVRARDFMAGDGIVGETAKALAIAAHLAGVPARSLHALKAADFVRLMGLIGPLLQGGPATPAMSPATSP